MTREQALNVLRPQGNSLDDLKVAYRQACKKYHPDINPDGLELMKIINVAYAFLKENINKWSYSQHTDDRPLTDQMQDIFDKIRHYINVKAEVCGAWLWLDGETWRYKKELKELKFKWAPKKRQWYWNDGTFRKKSKRVLSMNEIRNIYGSVELDQEPLKAVG